MKEYIPREAAIEAMYEDAETHPDHTFWTTQHEALRNIPAADVRPVVLCRDCECYQQSHHIDNHMECARSRFPVHSVDFCSFGEKRE